jgi:hypothetical protein
VWGGGQNQLNPLYLKVPLTDKWGTLGDIVYFDLIDPSTRELLAEKDTIKIFNEEATPISNQATS